MSGTEIAVSWLFLGMCAGSLVTMVLFTLLDNHLDKRRREDMTR